ncbi:MAG: rRNA maturation RNase YbeY [Micavibrio sp.]|nr:rRNA maturation RNase YbeY [Micavibrio sp.]|tara:strand:- start:290 stop:712 length:423 start_codon:yes stop_codon:yes gene_type:complete
MTAIINIFHTPEDIITTAEIDEVCRAALNDKAYSLSIEFMGDHDIQLLNKQFRHKDKPTNVLSFPNDDDNYIGDIAISIDTIKREASEQKKAIKDHILHMVIHGALHLLGYDHEEDEMAEEMEALEIEILDKFGINNPYI